jgi:hypothetical protein
VSLGYKGNSEFDFHPLKQQEMVPLHGIALLPADIEEKNGILSAYRMAKGHFLSLFVILPDLHAV